MKFIISEIIDLADIPSGSGIVKVGDFYYAIGDDSPYLFVLDRAFEIREKIPLQDMESFRGGRIAKSIKADFEALDMISENELVVFGSGSRSPQRDTFIQILLEPPIKVVEYSASAFYHSLKSLKVFSDTELNLEAAVSRNGYIFLLNRIKNMVLKFRYRELLNYLKGSGSMPEAEITRVTLPEIGGIEAGFSGASGLKNQSKIIFSASVENTGSAYDDGEILGSYIGIIDIPHNRVSGTIRYCQIPEQKGPFKVESVAVEEEISPTESKVVLITDDDEGGSVAIKGVLSW